MVEVNIEALDAALREERFSRARELLGAAPEGSAEAPRVSLRRARLERETRSVSVDETLLELERLLEAGLPEEDLPAAHALRIAGYGSKRILTLTEAAIEDAGEHAESAEVLLAEGTAMMRFDERERAHRCFQRALTTDPRFADHAHLALADALYVLGDFDAALAETEKIGAGPQRPRGLRLAASCHAARQDHGAEADVYRLLLEEGAAAAGDPQPAAQSDRVSYALALACAGRRADALEQLGLAWRQDPESGSGRFARERMNHLEAHPDGGRTKRLHAFPTTAQKWNYCGPAVLELCFRYLEIELTQEEIAGTVKRQTGTPMYEIVTYLRAHNIAARRIEATRARLMAAIDLGLPVIVQEEYSTTSHVAVITGYDEALGTFIAHDPATHRPLLKTFEFTKRAGDLYGNGGVIVLGREGPALAEREAACDEAGLLEAQHLVLLDDADRLRPAAAGGDRQEATTQEVLRRCADAIAIEPNFKLAWERRAHALHRLAQLSGRPTDRDRFLADLFHVRTHFARDEWPHQLHAHYMFDRNLRDEAYAEYLEASRRDPGDANNREWMGECMWLGGDLERAARHFLEALALNPTQVRSAENLAAVYARELLERHRGRGPVDSSLAPARVFERLSGEEAEMMRRAVYFNRIGSTVNPKNAFDHEVAGDLAAMRADWPAALEAFREAKALDPGRPFASLGLAHSMEKLGDLEGARAELSALTQHPRSPSSAFTRHADVLSALDRPADAAEALVAALSLDVDPVPIVGALFSVYERVDSKEAAAARLRELAAGRPSQLDLVRAAARSLDEKGQLGHAIALYRQLLEAAPGDVDTTYRLGGLLTRDLLTRPEGERLLSRVVEMAPTYVWARIRLAWSLIATDPARGLALLAELPDREDSYLLETQAALLARTGDEPASKRAFELALQTYGDPEDGLLALVDWHVAEKRYGRALELARQIPERVKRAELQRRADRLWLSAFRLAGAIDEALPRLRLLCAESVPDHLAYSIFWGLRAFDHELAAAAAAKTAARYEGQLRTTWRIRAAGQRARQGDTVALTAIADELEADVETSAESWALLSYAYADVERWDLANAAADRAIARDPNDQDALGAMEEALVRRGDVAGAFRCAQRLAEVYPYEHQGPESMGALLALQLEVERALPLTARAVDAAPYCHNAHWARAAALFAADEFDGAERHAANSLALEPPESEDEPQGSLMIKYALAGEAQKLEACLVRAYERRPADLFAAFDDKLRRIASERS